MALLAEGIWPCTVISGKAGEDGGVLKVQISVRIDEGPSAGRMCTYEEKVDTRQGPYIRRTCTAVGWKGERLRTLAEDCAAWIAATGGKSSVEIKHHDVKTGKRAGSIWDKVSSIGKGPKPLKEASPEAWADADDAMRMAADEPPLADDDHPF